MRGRLAGYGWLAALGLAGTGMMFVGPASAQEAPPTVPTTTAESPTPTVAATPSSDSPATTTTLATTTTTSMASTPLATATPAGATRSAAANPASPAAPAVLSANVATPAAALPVQADTKNCPDFTYQEDAQAVLDADPTDPNRLDADNDRVACEDLPHRPTAAAGTATTRAGTATTARSATATTPRASTATMATTGRDTPGQAALAGSLILLGALAVREANRRRQLGNVQTVVATLKAPVPGRRRATPTRTLWRGPLDRM